MQVVIEVINSQLNIDFFYKELKRVGGISGIGYGIGVEEELMRKVNKKMLLYTISFFHFYFDLFYKRKRLRTNSLL